MSEGELYERIIASADALYAGPHAGARALHAKGSWARGTFIATPRAAELSGAAHLQGEPVEAIARFSNASGDPAAPDYERDGRGLAVKLRWPGGEADILTTTSPAFVSRTPEDFLELMALRRPDPETGQPDMEKLGAYLAAHPESQPAAEAVLMREPLASFATATYFSPHAFALVSPGGERTWVRWRWHPVAGEQRIADEAARERGPDYLQADLGTRLATGSIAFELQFQIAEAEDPLDDPTAVWPDDRELVAAGRLELTERLVDPEGDGHIEVFDPMRIVPGVEPSADPILAARPHAYSVSAYRRLDSRSG